MCCGGSKGPKWKREVVKDHKFDYIDINEFYDPSCPARTSYMFMYILMIKGFLVYVADLWTAVSLLVIGNSSINADASIPPDVAKWIFLGAIMISFVLLFWDIRKSRGIVESRDISLAFFSVIANRWYSVKDYKYFCLFGKINRSRKQIDSIAFFVFFTLKGWKKLLLAEAPRQVINVVTLKTIIPAWIQINNGLKISNDGLGRNTVQRIMTGTMIFSTAVFAVSFILLCAAAIIYIPVLCHIQGNLKEYCCHKVDKRIEELLKKQAKKRIEKNKKADQYSHHHHQKKSSKKDSIEMESLPQPTLPKVGMNSLSVNNYYPHQQAPRQHYQQHQQQPSFTGSVNNNPGRPNYYPQVSSSNSSTLMGSQFTRRNSLSSVGSDQVGLTSHAQGQPWSSTPYYQSNGSHNGSSSNLSYSIQHQQYQQPYPQYNNYHQQHQQHQNYY
ncbi:uncharacterized protein ATC70_002988 [Mucor velutinosus]|uniref:Uncharacterized protein n=1 Tax=Mucor velutinosus TaxID=708070 RepID=A0AAN7DCQ6_9FUNG|nr:hypothetical protein ATC70_002988 [Mucor velutinosus]